MSENNKKVIKILQELRDSGCKATEDKYGKPINVCVGTDTDMGKRRIIQIGDKVKDFDSVSNLTKDLHKKGVPNKDIIEIRGFVSSHLRDAIRKVEDTEINGSAFGFGGKYKKLKDDKT